MCWSSFQSDVNPELLILRNLDSLIVACDVTCNKSISLAFRNSTNEPISIATPYLWDTFIDLYNNGIKLQRRSKIRVDPICATRAIQILSQSDTTNHISLFIIIPV